MAQGGRPVERPTHLSPDQRSYAQQRTRQWRAQCGLSQAEMAARIGVSPATYRSWENPRDDHAGPTRLLADALNKALKRLLGDQYTDGDAFDVWGWPKERDMTYDRVVELLHSAGFDVPRLQAGAKPPVRLFWVHRLRQPHLVHGVFALAAAAATRAGLPVDLLLDDMGLPERDRHRYEEFEDRVRRWVVFASGEESKLSIGRFSTVLTHGYLTVRAWPAINDYLSTQSTVLEVLRASKVISPQAYGAHADESVLALLREEDSLTADRLLTPLRNWLVFEAEVARLRDTAGSDDVDCIVTLGGEDERILWELWHRGCSEELASRVRHMYLRPVPMPRYRAPWKEPALSVSTSRSLLTNYVANRAATDGHSDLIEWLLRTCVRLPAALNPGFHDALDPSLSDLDALLRAPGSQLPGLAGPVAKAVVEWFTA